MAEPMPEEKTNEVPFTFIDLFAGCGGFSLGLKSAGMICQMAVEIDPDACETYRANLGDHIVCEDVRRIDTNTVPECDVLVGGFPCQPFSISGLQKGFDGKGGDLFYECVRFIKALRPKVFILENVPGFARLQKGAFLKEAVRTLSTAGYVTDWRILNAADFGVAQTRERLFIIGNSLGLQNAFPIPMGRRITTFEAIDEIRHNMTKFENNEPMRHTDRIKMRFAAVAQGESALDAMKRDSSLGTAKITKQCYRRLFAHQPAPTIVANFVTTTIHYCEDRNLTAREAARLQSFPDSFVFKGLKTRMSWQKGLSQFEQIGNAVPPKLAKALGEAIHRVLSYSMPKAEPFLAEQDLFGYDKPILQVKSQEGKKNGMRGRKSRFASIYNTIQSAPIGEPVKLAKELPVEFFIFLDGAMRRRQISFNLERLSDGSAILTKNDT
jgi:DNA (cytosine-5)-methyltransferase 1